MSKQMKFIVFLMLVMLSEISATHLQTQFAYRRHRFTGKNRLLLTLPDNPLIEKIKAKFNQLGAAAENSKLFNFMLGAAIKTFSLLEGNEVLDIAKCIVTTIEVYYNAIKFPEKNLKELKDLAKADEKTAAAELAKADGKEDINDPALAESLKQSEIGAREVDCESNSEIMKDPDGLDYIDEVETEEETPQKFLQMDSSIHFNPKKLLKKLKDKFKNLKNKFADLMEKLKKKLTKLEETVKVWLNKPVVKALIAFFECALVPILGLALKAASGITGIVTGFSVINIVKQGPKFLKMIIDGIKSIRGGFLKKTVKEKYQEYGKGSAALVTAIVLAAVGSS